MATRRGGPTLPDDPPAGAGEGVGRGQLGRGPPGGGAVPPRWAGARRGWALVLCVCLSLCMCVFGLFVPWCVGSLCVCVCVARHVWALPLRMFFLNVYMWVRVVCCFNVWGGLHLCLCLCT